MENKYLEKIAGMFPKSTFHLGDLVERSREATKMGIHPSKLGSNERLHFLKKYKGLFLADDPWANKILKNNDIVTKHEKLRANAKFAKSLDSHAKKIGPSDEGYW